MARRPQVREADSDDGSGAGLPRAGGGGLIRGVEDAGLVGRLLVAMPELRDSEFSRSVIYICEQSSLGVMGLVINRAAPRVDFPSILRQLGIEEAEGLSGGHEIQVQTGGPVGSGRGFVLHSDDYLRESTLQLPAGMALTGTVDILRAISHGRGPRKSFLALGYAGWGAGQLERELSANAWLTAEPDESLLFDMDLGARWERALESVGVRAARLSGFSGRA